MQRNHLNDDDASGVRGAAPAETASPAGRLPVRCGNCEVDVTPTHHGLCPTCGRFLPRNTAAVTHGAHATPSREDLDWRRDLVERLVTERGGRTQVTAITMVRIADYATAATQLRNVSRRLNLEGPVTSAGRRKALVDIYRAFSERVERLGAELGGPVFGQAQALRPFASLSSSQLIAHAESLIQALRTEERNG